MPPNSPLERSALIQRAIDLDGIDRSDEAKADLEKLIAAAPTDVEAITALGNLERGRKQFAECGDAYSKALAITPKPDKSAWTLFYFRGICFERSKQWPKAEADLKKALELFPDQPHVLNYLGYSWVDKGMNLDEGMRTPMRVEQRADDGYRRPPLAVGSTTGSANTRRRSRSSTAPSSSSPRIRPSTITWAMPIGRSAVWSRRAFNGRMRAISGRNPTISPASSKS